MYEKLARGHATACIDNIQDFGDLKKWISGYGRKESIKLFIDFKKSKKPGKVLNRLAPVIKPCFKNLKIKYWSRYEKKIIASGLAGNIENHVYDLPEDSKPIYSERAIFMINLRLMQINGKINCGIMARTAISRHAIARLVERECLKPEFLQQKIASILNDCCLFTKEFDETKLDQDAMLSFMMPYEKGALVMVRMKMNPMEMFGNKGDYRVFSARTWLAPDMLKDLDRERMGGFRQSFADLKAGNNESFLRWLEGNARPWHFTDETLHNKTRPVDVPDFIPDFEMNEPSL